MASPTVFETATHGRSFSFCTLAPSSHPSSRRHRKARSPVLPSAFRFPTKSRSWSDLGLRVAARIPRCCPVAASLKSSPSFELPKEDDPTVENSVANTPPPPSSATMHFQNNLTWYKNYKEVIEKVLLSRWPKQRIRHRGIPGCGNEASFDMKLPRRNLLVQFTCNSCGARTQRIINRVAYEQGTVFVQCAGCLVHHKLIDNLNLVVEYDLRSDPDTQLDTSRHDQDMP